MEDTQSEVRRKKGKYELNLPNRQSKQMHSYTKMTFYMHLLFYCKQNIFEVARLHLECYNKSNFNCYTGIFFK